MLFPDAVISDLARTWTKLHRSAARGHLELLIRQLELAGDIDGVANYARVLEAVIAADALLAAIERTSNR